jgi:hypothetical protein
MRRASKNEITFHVDVSNRCSVGLHDNFGKFGPFIRVGDADKV